MTQTLPLTEYDPAILVRAPRAQAGQLARSAAADRGHLHSVLSLSVLLGVWPVVVHDVLRVMVEEIRRQSYQDAHEAHDASAAVLTRLDEDAERAVWSGDRWGGTYELPVDHDEFDGHSEIGDRYVTGEAVAYVLECVHPAIVTGLPAEHGVSGR